MNIKSEYILKPKNSFNKSYIYSYSYKLEI